MELYDCHNYLGELNAIYCLRPASALLHSHCSPQSKFARAATAILPNYRVLSVLSVEYFLFITTASRAILNARI